MGVAYQLFRFRIVFGTHRICSVFVDGLRHQSEVSHDRNTGTENTFYRPDDFFPAFQLQSVCMALLHNTDGRGKAFHFISLIGTERHIHHYHCALYTFPAITLEAESPTRITSIPAPSTICAMV